jgi:hypothetical protein
MAEPEAFTVFVQLKNRQCQFRATEIEETGDYKSRELIVKNVTDVFAKYQRAAVIGWWKEQPASLNSILLAEVLSADELQEIHDRMVAHLKAKGTSTDS